MKAAIFEVAIAMAASVASLTAALDIYEQEDLDYAYSVHMTKFGLAYNSVEEYTMRKALFAATDKLIREHNASDSSY